MPVSVTAPNAQYRGPGGFLSTPALDNTVLSTYLSPTGIDEYLPAIPTTTANPLYAVFMGVGAESGAEPDGVCDDAPTALMTAGHLTAQFGRIIRDTPTIDRGQLAQTARGEETSLTFLARQGSQGSLYPGMVGNTNADILTNAARGSMFVVGEQLKRKYSKLLWSGSTSNNDPSKPGYLEFPGIDAQVATGQVDALTNTALTDLDSYIVDANFANVASYDIVAQMEDLEYQLYSRAIRTFSGAEFVLAMRPELWHQITALWPIQYNTQAVSNLLNSSGVSVNVDGGSLVSERDAMRQSQMLTVNGRSYRVILDDGIYMHDSTHASLGAGEFASSIYMLPLSVNGGFPVLEIQYLDFRNGDTSAFPGFAQNAESMLDASDGGRYMWAMVQSGWCFKFKARIEPRVVLRAPQLAGKIQRVKWAPMSMPQSPYPGKTYAQAGGLSVTTAPTDYAVWGS